MATRLWKIYCMENKFPGMWQRWFKNQCAAVGWAKEQGYHLNDPSKRGGWIQARNCLNQIQRGDFIIVALNRNRVGRLGEVTEKKIADDEWNPLVPGSKDRPEGEMGRRIHVRWDLTVGPDDRDLIVVLPRSAQFNSGERRHTVTEISSQTLDNLRAAMKDRDNWEGLASQFSSEKSLSDYIAAYPHRLEDGLLPHPDKKVRERIFSDRKRLDVLLTDQNDKPVIVECKQRQPTVQDIRQLQHYLNKFSDEEGKEARGILVHGGARKLRDEVRQAAKETPNVELVQFSVGVDFSISG